MWRRVELGARIRCQRVRVEQRSRFADFADFAWIVVARNGSVRVSTMADGWDVQLFRLRARHRRIGAELHVVVRAPFAVTVDIEPLAPRRRA